MGLCPKKDTKLRNRSRRFVSALVEECFHSALILRSPRQIALSERPASDPEPLSGHINEVAINTTAGFHDGHNQLTLQRMNNVFRKVLL